MKGQIKTEVTPSQGCGKAGASFIAFIFVFHQSNRRKKAGRMEQTGERQMWVFYYKRYLFPQSPSKLRIKMMKGNRGVSSRPAPRAKPRSGGAHSAPSPEVTAPSGPGAGPSCPLASRCLAAWGSAGLAAMAFLSPPPSPCGFSVSVSTFPSAHKDVCQLGSSPPKDLVLT